MVGLAFGRTGCLLNGCCFGGRCSPNWALAARFPMYSKPLVKCDGRANPFSLSTDAPSPPWVHQWAKGQVAPDPKLLDAAGRLMPPRDFNDEQAAIAEASWSLPVKPAQAIGAASALVIAGLLGAFYRLRKAEGQVFALMLMMYPVTRFVLESIRDDNLHNLSAGVLTHNQYSSIAIFLIGAAMMLAIRRLPPSAGPAARQRAAAPSQPGARPADKPRWNKRS